MQSCASHEMGNLNLNPNPNPILRVVAVFYWFAAIITVQGVELKTFTAEYGPFNETDYDIFEVICPASISNGALQLTPDWVSTNTNFQITHNSARILLRQPFKMWEADVNKPKAASFNTSFLVNFNQVPNRTRSEGLAFVIAPNLLLPHSSTGQFLGLMNSQTDNSMSNQLVAVELDTFKQDFDPDDNHLGLDINSIRSTKTVSLTPYNITLAPLGTRFHNIWIDYDGLNCVIQVFIAEQLTVNDPTPLKPSAPVLSADLNLKDYVNQDSYFGFSASSGQDYQLNAILRWNFTIRYFSETENKKQKYLIKIAVAIGVPALVLLLICAGMLGYYIHKRQMEHSSPTLIDMLKCLPGTPREF